MDYRARFYSPSLKRFIQPDSITPGMKSQSGNRYSYVLNNPINANDPSGHKCVGEPEECLKSDGSKGGGFTGGGNNGNSSNNNGGGDDGDGDGGGDGGDGGGGDGGGNDNSGSESSSPNLEDITQNTTINNSPCKMFFSASSCQMTSVGLSIIVLISDLVSLGLSTTGVIMELVGAAAGPEGLAAAVALYAETLNPIENALGLTSGAITTFNDFLITGESYVKLNTPSQGTPSLEMVLGSDTSVAVVTTGLGFSPEGVSDSIINGGAVVYDAYRLAGGNGLLQTHITMVANGNIHLNFSFPNSSTP